jgi:hypothetical protein
MDAASAESGGSRLGLREVTVERHLPAIQYGLAWLGTVILGVAVARLATSLRPALDRSGVRGELGEIALRVVCPLVPSRIVRITVYSVCGCELLKMMEFGSLASLPADVA